MKNLEYRPPGGKKPWYKRWKVWGYTFGSLIIVGIAIGVILDASGYRAEQEAIEREEAMARLDAELKEKAKKEAEWEVKLAEIDEAIAEEEKKAVEVSSPNEFRPIEIKVRTEEYAAKYDGSEIIELKINENIGADDGSYIVLAYMNYSRQNSAKMSRNMIEMFSSDLAANLAEEDDISAVTVFWEVPRFVGGSNAAKFAYERLGDGMRLESQHIALELQVE